MQEKKNKRLAIQFGLLLTATVILYIFMQKPKVSEVDAAIFQGYNMEEVDQVTLQSQIDTVNLTLSKGRWQVNETYEADPNLIQVLVATLTQAVPKRPVGNSIQDSISNLLQKEGVKVSVFSNGKVMEQLYVGGNPSKTQAFFKKASDEQVYIMTIPGYRVYVSGIFELPSNGWREKYVFGFNWRNFKSLDVAFPQATAENFSISMDETGLSVDGLEQADTSRLNSFLDAVSLLTVDEYLDNGFTRSKDRVIQTLKVRDIANKEFTLSIYRPSGNGPIVGLIDSTQWATFSQSKIREILKNKDFFIIR